MQQRLLVPPPGTHAFDNLGEQPGLALLAARQAIAQHRYAEAMSIYRRQIAGNQDDIDAYGELGNLLWFTEHRQEAAQNYYEAATRLLDRGLREVARPLLPAIEQYEPVLASLLRQKAAQFDR
jgi:tetratricopeptide (TPR) repeat protein